MTELLKRLQDYGIDLERTMARFVGDEQLYDTCLYSFFAGDDLNTLRDALRAGDYRAAFERAHSLKGVSGNLGLDPLYKKVCALVEPLRRGEYDNLDALYRDIESEMDHLRRLLPPAPQ